MRFINEGLRYTLDSQRQTSWAPHTEGHTNRFKSELSLLRVWGLFRKFCSEYGYDLNMWACDHLSARTLRFSWWCVSSSSGLYVPLHLKRDVRVAWTSHLMFIHQLLKLLCSTLLCALWSLNHSNCWVRLKIKKHTHTNTLQNTEHAELNNLFK